MNSQVLDFCKSVCSLDDDYFLANKEYWCEVYFSKMLGAKLTPSEGYDLTHDKLGRIEVKTTHSWFIDEKAGALAVSGLNTKKGKCDYFLVYDGMHHRASLMPHDEFFEACYTEPGDKGRIWFRWGIRDTIKPEATKLFETCLVDVNE